MRIQSNLFCFLSSYIFLYAWNERYPNESILIPALLSQKCFSYSTFILLQLILLFIFPQGLIKVDKEIERLNKKEEYLKQVIAKLKDQAAAEDYATKVPENVRTQNSEKLSEAEGELSRLPAALAALKLIQ